MKNKVISLILILILSCFSIKTYAVSQQELENQKSQIKNEISTKEDEIKNVKTELSESAQEVQNLINQISKNENLIDELNNKISEVENDISKKEKEITDTQTKIDEMQSLLEKRLVAIYQSGNFTYLDLLLSSVSLTDFISKYYLMSEIINLDTEIINKTQKEKEKLEIAKKDLSVLELELENNKAELEKTMLTLNSTKKEKESKVSKLSSEERKLSDEIDKLKERENKVNGQIQKLKEEYDKKLNTQKINSSNSSNKSSNSNNSTSSYSFCYPVSNLKTLGTLYGTKGKYWSLGYHTGIDFEVSSGTAIYSIGDGEVVDTGYTSAYGNYVEIYHGNNIYSFYAHNTKVIVSIGQMVSRGEQISTSGATGNVTGAHLHFEIRTPGSKFANCVDPLKYLP